MIRGEFWEEDVDDLRQRQHTDGSPNNITELATSIAVYTFDLVGSDDNVRKGTTGLDDKHSISSTTFSLAGTRDTAVECSSAAIERSSSGNGLFDMSAPLSC